MSLFSQEEIDAMNAAQSTEKTVPDDTDASDEQTADKEKSAVVYTCLSCGAEIVTDETTAATFCYYCHNPVVLGGRLEGDFLPDKVIPCSVSAVR